MSQQPEQMSDASGPRRHDTQPGCGLANLWILLGTPAFAVAGYLLADEYGFLWAVLAAAGGAIAAVLATPAAVFVFVAIIHVSIKIEDRFKPFPPSARAIRKMPTLRRADGTTPPTVVFQVDCFRHQRLKMLAVLLGVLAGIAIFTYFALFLDYPLDVEGDEMTAAQGRVFFGVCAGVSAIGLIPLGWLVYTVCARRRRVVLTDVALIVPRSPFNEFACGEIEIPLESISGVSVCDFGGSSQLLVIEHQSGKITLPSCMFPRGRQFAELAWVLTEACNNREPDEETASP